MVGAAPIRTASAAPVSVVASTSAEVAAVIAATFATIALWLVPHVAPLNAFGFIALSAAALAAKVTGLVAVVAFAVDRRIERVVRSVGVFAKTGDGPHRGELDRVAALARNAQEPRDVRPFWGAVAGGGHLAREFLELVGEGLKADLFAPIELIALSAFHVSYLVSTCWMYLFVTNNH
ncbi:hypothetical protein AaE_007409, partial [Aphanomyces astaci]